MQLGKALSRSPSGLRLQPWRFLRRLGPGIRERRRALARRRAARPRHPALGNPQGDITIVEHSTTSARTAKRPPRRSHVVAEDGKVKLVLKDSPMSARPRPMRRGWRSPRIPGQIRGRGRCADRGEGEAHRGRGRRPPRQAGVDVTRAAGGRDAHAAEIDALHARNDAQARAFGFQGTPGFIIGTFRVPGALNTAGFKRAISDARKATAMERRPRSTGRRARRVVEP